MLYEKYRPSTLHEVLGQPGAVAAVQSILGRGGFGGKAVWLSGATGTGKTTLARIIAGTLADPWAVVEYDSADLLTMDELRGIHEAMPLAGMGKGGRVWIINEAHGMRAPIIRALLGLLERIPRHCAFIFTTTRAGEDGLFEDQIDAAPLLARCLRVRLTNQGLAEPFAVRALEIARAEGLDGGADLPAVVRLVKRCKNSMRAVLSELESGTLLAAPALAA